LAVSIILQAMTVDFRSPAQPIKKLVNTVLGDGPLGGFGSPAAKSAAFWVGLLLLAIPDVIRKRPRQQFLDQLQTWPQYSIWYGFLIFQRLHFQYADRTGGPEFIVMELI
jgi:hypothetical protein